MLLSNFAKIEGVYFYLRTLLPVCKGVGPKGYNIIKELRGGFNINHVEPLPVDELVIHVRSGDVFSEAKPHSGYGQLPFAFYEKILLAGGWAKVYIVFEDQLNPVIDLIEQYGRENDMDVEIISGKLKEDVEFMLRAGNIVAGFGSFIPSVVSLSENVKNVYCFESGFGNWGRNDIKIKRVFDMDGEYKRRVMSNNWVNSDEQIDLMRNYSVSKVDFK